MVRKYLLSILSMYKIFYSKRKNEGCINLKSEYKELESLKRYCYHTAIFKQ